MYCPRIILFIQQLHKIQIHDEEKLSIKWGENNEAIWLHVFWLVNLKRSNHSREYIVEIVWSPSLIKTNHVTTRVRQSSLGAAISKYI